MHKDLFNGDHVRFEYSGTPTSAAAVTVYRNGSSVTFAAGEQLIITGYTMVNSHTAAQQIDFFDDRDGDGAVDAGERIDGGIFSANGGVAKASLGTPVYCKPGAAPKVLSASGPVQLSGQGRLVKNS